MKNLLKKYYQALIVLPFLLVGIAGYTQADSTTAEEVEKPELFVTYQYFNKENNFQYLQVLTRTKVENRFQPVTSLTLKLYLDSASDENLIATVKTDDKGEAKAILPPALKEKWNSSDQHLFIAVSEANKTFGESTTEINITKSRILIDTLNEEGTRSVSVQVQTLSNGAWVPAGEVDVKIAVKRLLGGELLIGEEETYTTDSLGQAVGEFKRDSLPSDAKGNIVLIAKVEDNEQLGNLSIERAVPWGANYKIDETHYGFRALWSTGNRAPWWLIGMSYGTIAIVWGSLIYLVFQLIRMIRMGKNKEKTPPAKANVELVS